MKYEVRTVNESFSLHFTTVDAETEIEAKFMAIEILNQCEVWDIDISGFHFLTTGDTNYVTVMNPKNITFDNLMVTK